MKEIRRLCLAALVTTILCIPTWAGPMDTPAPVPPPPATESDEGSSGTAQVVTPDPMLETVLSVIQSICLIY